ncbi:MAG: transglutaminase-like domain-containing protein [Candidatus Njordarchaeia archaeon]
MELIISRDKLRFVSPYRVDFMGFKCDKFVKLGNNWNCIIKIPKNYFLGVNIFNLKLPPLSSVKIEGFGLHTKILVNGELIDHFEVGGPIRYNIGITFKLIGKNVKGNNVILAAPPDNHHQKVLKIKPLQPHEEIPTNKGERFIKISLPEKLFKEGVEVGYSALVETHGFDAYHRCVEDGCKPLKVSGERVVEDDKLKTVVEEISNLNNLVPILEAIFKFLQQNVKYRINYERFGGLYSLKMGFGACDEISDLVLLILKGAGFNARFVSGYHAKSETKLIGHSWVEIETTKGWLPFDPTAKMFGIGMRWIKITSTQLPNGLVELPKGVKVVGHKAVLF